MMIFYYIIIQLLVHNQNKYYQNDYFMYSTQNELNIKTFFFLLNDRSISVQRVLTRFTKV